jgi:hypothetical protein
MRLVVAWPMPALISKYGMFIWEVVKAHVATSPKYFEPVHYRGEGISMISGRQLARVNIHASRWGWPQTCS